MTSRGAAPIAASRDRRIRALGLVTLLGGPALLACPGSSRPPREPDTTAATDAGDSGTDESATVESGHCVEEEPSFANFDFLPDEVRFVALTINARDDEALRAYESALATAPFAGPAQGPGALSGDTQLAIAGIGFERHVVARTLEKIGVNAQSMLKLEAPSGKTMWLAPHRCDLGLIRERAAAHWGMELREAVGGWVGTPSADSRLPFDLIAMSGDILVLAPRGQGAPSLAWFTRAHPGSASAVGPWLAAEAPAPWRIIVQDAFQSAGAKTRAALRVAEGRRALVDLPTASLPEP